MKKFLLIGILFMSQLLATAQQSPYKIIAYYMGNADSLRTYPLNKLTHVIYSFLHLGHDSLTFDNEEQRNTVKKLGELKKDYPHLKIMISLGGWGGCEPCSAVFSTEKQRNTFAETTVSIFEDYNIDGIDLDWEYPAISGYPGHRYDSSDKQNFTALVKTLRGKMGDKYLLTFAAGGFQEYLEKSVDWDEVMPAVDFVNLMTYDLVSGFSKTTGHHTALKDYLPNQQSTQRCVNWLIAKGISSEKLVIGAAFYGRVWEKVEGRNNGLYNAGSFKESVSYRNFDSYFSKNSGFTYHWDEKAAAPFRYNPAKKLFATFDDERSIKAKCVFVKEKKLGGIMFWELQDDKKNGGLVDAMAGALQ